MRRAGETRKKAAPGLPQAWTAAAASASALAPGRALARKNRHHASSAPMAERIYLYDTTLRDGGQTHGVDFTIADKVAIAAAARSARDRLRRGRLAGRQSHRRRLLRPPTGPDAGQALRLRDDPARRPQRRERPWPCGAVPERDRCDHPGRQELGAAGGAGARRRARREPAHDRGQRGRGVPARARGAVRRRALLRRLPERSGLRPRLPRCREARWRPLDRAVRHQRRPPAARDRGHRRAGRGVNTAGPTRHPRPQRHRERGRQHHRRRARRRAPGAGHAERPGRALRQRQSDRPDPDADAQDGLCDRASRRRACAV